MSRHAHSGAAGSSKPLLRISPIVFPRSAAADVGIPFTRLPLTAPHGSVSVWRVLSRRTPSLLPRTRGFVP